MNCLWKIKQRSNTIHRLHNKLYSFNVVYHQKHIFLTIKSLEDKFWLRTQFCLLDVKIHFDQFPEMGLLKKWKTSIIDLVKRFISLRIKCNTWMKTLSTYKLFYSKPRNHWRTKSIKQCLGRSQTCHAPTTSYFFIDSQPGKSIPKKKLKYHQ